MIYELRKVENKPEVEISIDKSVLNMLDFYREPIMALKNNGRSCDSIPKGTRRRLIESGVLRKFGSKYELTKMGYELLHPVHAKTIVLNLTKDTVHTER